MKEHNNWKGHLDFFIFYFWFESIDCSEQRLEDLDWLVLVGFMKISLRSWLFSVINLGLRIFSKQFSLFFFSYLVAWGEMKQERENWVLENTIWKLDSTKKREKTTYRSKIWGGFLWMKFELTTFFRLFGFYWIWVKRKQRWNLIKEEINWDRDCFNVIFLSLTLLQLYLLHIRTTHMPRVLRFLSLKKLGIFQTR